MAATEIAGRLDESLVAQVAANLHLSGRMESAEEGDVPVLLDAAHNPDGARALAEGVAARHDAPLVGCLAILEDKDAAGIMAALAPVLAAVVSAPRCPRERLARGGRAGARTVPAADLAALAGRGGGGGRARPAGRIPAGGGACPRPFNGRPRGRFPLPSRLRCEAALTLAWRHLGMNREARSELLHMMGLVAAVVALVILVFFGWATCSGGSSLGPASLGLRGPGMAG